MGFGAKGQKAKPSYTGVQLQTASSVLPVALVGGMTRIAPNLWDYTDFKSHKQKVKAGKGFGGSATTFTYSATVIQGLCAGGPDGIAGVARAWKDQGEEADYSAFGYTLFTGTIPQAPWGYMVAAHPEKADGYPGGAYLAKANDDLGQSASLGNRSYEVQAILYMTGVGGTVPDADPALWSRFFLTDADEGVGMPADLLDTDGLLSGADATTTGDSAYQTYCRAMGFAISPAMVEQEAAGEALARWCLITNTAPVWTGDKLKLIPYGDEAVTANGVTFLPPTAVRYDLTDDDYIQSGDEDPIRPSRSDPADAKNIVNLVIRDRANAYNEVPVPFQDDNAIALHGPKPLDPISAREVCDLAMAGKMVALVGQRLLYSRNRYEFTLDPRYDRLEPMDVVTATDARLGMAQLRVRLEEIDEDESDNLSCLAVHFPGTTGTPSTGATGTGSTPTDVNSLTPPGPVNPPIIFEPPSTLAQRLFGSASPVVVAAVSGGDGASANPNWGGCIVWVSTDNATYQAVGEIEAPARMGLTTAALAAYGGVNPDAANTLAVDLAISDGELESASSTDAAAGATISVIRDADGTLEFVGYAEVTLTGADAYDLGELYRGLHGSAPGAHLAGADFARLDGSVFRFDLPAAYVGVPLWFKFQSFNIWGQALEDLAGCVAYRFTPQGAGFGGGAGGIPTPPSGLAATPAGTSIALTWNANPAGDNVTGYEVWRAPGAGADFEDAAKLATVTGQAWSDPSIAASTAYTYFLRAVNAIGASAESAGVDVLSGAAAGGGVPGATGNPFIPLANGANPPALVANGAGDLILVAIEL